jgi:hypothetical protein
MALAPDARNTQRLEFLRTLDDEELVHHMRQFRPEASLSNVLELLINDLPVPKALTLDLDAAVDRYFSNEGLKLTTALYGSEDPRYHWRKEARARLFLYLRRDEHLIETLEAKGDLEKYKQDMSTLQDDEYNDPVLREQLRRALSLVDLPLLQKFEILLREFYGDHPEGWPVQPSSLEAQYKSYRSSQYF